MLNFGTNFEKTGIFVNSFMKHNIKLRQKKFLTIFEKNNLNVKKNYKTLWKLIARQFLSKSELKFMQILTVILSRLLEKKLQKT